MEGNKFNSLKFITAPSAIILQKKMLKNNIESNIEHVYHNVQYVASDGIWYAWFYYDFKEEIKDQAIKKLKGE